MRMQDAVDLATSEPLQVASRVPGGLPNSEMTRILNGITLGNVHDDSTWTPGGDHDPVT